MNPLAIITGGTKGIGLSVAKLFLEHHYNVLLTYGNDEASAQSVLKLLNGIYPGNVEVLKADSTDLDSIETIYEHLQNRGLHIDALILNAGITDRSPFTEIDRANWSRVFTANVHFPTFLIQKLLPLFRKNASIVFTGSTMAIQPHSVSLAYGVTKSAVHALVKNMVKILSPLSIRINAVAPGFVDTDWQKTKPIEIKNTINKKIALNRFCEPDEVAQVYLFLVENKYINGEIICIDGGYSFS